MKNQDHAWLGLAIRITLATFIAIFTAKILNFPQGIFLVLATPILMIINPTELKSTQLKSLLLSSILTCIGVYSVTWFEHSLMLILLITAIFAMITGCAMRYGQLYHTAGILALFLILAAGGIAVQPDQALWRTINCGIGAIIAIVFNLIFIRQNFEKQLKKTKILFLNNTRSYFCYVTSDFLRGSYALNRGLKLKEEIIKNLQKIRIYEQRTFEKSKERNKISEYLEEFLECICGFVTVLANPVNRLSLINIINKVEIFRDVSMDYFESVLNSGQNNTKIREINKDIAYLQIDAAKNFSSNLSLPVQDQYEGSREIKLEQFNQTFDKLYQDIQCLIVDMLQQDVVYNWPFDLKSFLYLLRHFQKNMNQLHSVFIDE